MSNVKILKGFQPKILIDNNAFNKMEQYIAQCNLEIGWLGCAERVGKDFFISDVFLFKQEVHATTTEINPEGLSEFAMELMQEENGMDKWNSMRVWGHSHVNMGVTPSGQDEKQIEVFTENNNEFFIRIIANKRGEYNITVYDYKVGIIYEKMDYSLVFENNVKTQIDLINSQIKVLRDRLERLMNPREELIEEIQKEMNMKVSEKKYAPVTTYQNQYGNGCSYYNTGSYKKKETKNESEIGALEYFTGLSDEEIEIAYSMFLEGMRAEEIFIGIDLEPKELIKLEDMIIDECESAYYF